MRIKTERLVLRPFRLGDDVDLFDMTHDPMTAYDAGWKPHPDIYTTRNVILGYMYSDETLAITFDNHVIGTISLYRTNLRKNMNCREMGFCLNKKFRNQGFISEAIEAMLHYGFFNQRLDMIMICHHANNEASKKVISKFPFRFEGILRMYRKLYNGDIIDGVFYSMTKDEYEEWKYERIKTKI